MFLNFTLISTAEIKYQIIADLTEIEDVSVLDKIKKYLASIKNKTQDAAIGYDSNNNPVTTNELVELHEQALDRINKGEFTTHEDVVKEAKNW